MQPRESKSPPLLSADMDISFLLQSTGVVGPSPHTTLTPTLLPGSTAQLATGTPTSFPRRQISQTVAFPDLSEPPDIEEHGIELLGGLDRGHIRTPANYQIVQNMEQAPVVVEDQLFCYAQELQVFRVFQHQSQSCQMKVNQPQAATKQPEPIREQLQVHSQQPRAAPQFLQCKGGNQQYPQVVDTHVPQPVPSQSDGHAQSPIKTDQRRRGSQKKICDDSILIKRRRKAQTKGKTNSKKKKREVICDHPGCYNRYANRSNMKRHYEEKHGSRKRYHCTRMMEDSTRCTSSFAEHCKLKNHIAMVHEKKRPHSCDTCHRLFAQKSDLIRHNRAVHLKWKYKCVNCGKVASRKANLTRAHDKCPGGYEITDVQRS